MKTFAVYLVVALVLEASLSQAKSLHTPTSGVFSPSHPLEVGILLSAWTVDVQSDRSRYYGRRRRRRRRRNWGFWK